jgi:iron complex transport system substrate-binding protein
LDWVNAENVAKKASETDHVFIDKEKLIAWNPRIIFVDGLGLKLVADDYNRNVEYYQSLEAFQRKRVYLLYPFNSYVVNLGTTIADAYAVGKVCYPDKFSDIDVEKKADEAYSFLLKKPVYDSMKQDFGILGAVPSFLDAANE